MTNPLVSVLIPCYNCRNFIEETILSIISQTYQTIEIVVVDNSSTDGTKELLEQWITEQKYKNLKVIFAKNNSGIAGGRNQAFENSSGEYVIYLDADDLLMPECISENLKFLQANPQVDVVVCDTEYFDNETGKIMRISSSNLKDPLKHLLLRDINVISSITSVFASRKIFEAVGKWDNNLWACEDWDYWLRLTKVAKMLHLPKVLNRYRQHQNQITKKIPIMVSQANLAFQKAKERGDFEYVDSRMPKNKFYKICKCDLMLINSGNFFHHTYRWDIGFIYLLKAFITSPSHFFSRMKEKIQKRFKMD